MTWDGVTERRKNSTVFERLENLEQDISEIKDILTQGKGIANFIRLVLYVGAPIYAVWMWAKDHIK